jgi:UDPglucose 6-dehydrogenase
MKLTVIGTGFVGVVSAAVFASFENDVTGLDIDPKKVEALRQGKVPFFEPGLEDLLRQEQSAGHLSFTTDYAAAIPEADVVFVAVGTPSAPDGNADLRYVKMAVESAAPHLKEGAILAIKSTVPPGTLEELRPILEEHAPHAVILASLPEFLREGSAVQDTLHPDRVVIGCSDDKARQILQKLHSPLKAPVIFTKPESAQMGKYAANAYLATRISFINQIADLCERNGADVQEVIEIIGHDKRIGPHYWYPGLGYGGSCFPKDVRELAAYSRSIGLGGNLFNKIHELNEDRIFQKLDAVEALVGGWSGKTVAVLGLSFKPNTDDMREAPSTKVVPHLLQHEAKVKAFDPMALESATQWFPSNPNLELHDSVEKALEGADAVLCLIEWSQITGFDFVQWKQQHAADRDVVFFDARNQFDISALQKAGLSVIAIGRGSQA